jgi:hypothetical protein
MPAGSSHGCQAGQEAAVQIRQHVCLIEQQQCGPRLPAALLRLLRRRRGRQAGLLLRLAWQSGRLPSSIACEGTGERPMHLGHAGVCQVSAAQAGALMPDACLQLLAVGAPADQSTLCATSDTAYDQRARELGVVR